MSRNILVLRHDRLGDVMTALPTLDWLSQELLQDEITFSCSKTFHSLLKNFCDEQTIRLISPEAIEPRRYDAALVLSPDSKVAFQAKIPIRVGNYSKFGSFFFLNRGIRQSRTAGKKNEVEYSIELGRKLLKALKENVGKPNYYVILPLNNEAVEESRRIVPDDDFIVLHPGSGGSGLNVPAEKYLQMANSFERKGVKVYVSCGPSEIDKKQVENLKSYLLPEVSLPVLSELYRRARLVIAPSTGPLHLAHFVGTSVLGLFSPIPTQSPERWRPMGGVTPSTILLPDVPCPAINRCLGKDCREFDCMEKYDWLSKVEKASDGLFLSK